MRFLDTNIVIRYLTKDDQQKAAACLALFQRVSRGEEEIMTTEAIITEVVHVLSSPSLYRLSHEEVRDRLAAILTFRGLKLSGKRVYLRALDLYAAHPSLDFEEALCAALMEQEGLTEVYNYDRDFDRLDGIRRVEPEMPQTGKREEE